MPIGLLMMEHRLIERMIAVLRLEALRVRKKKTANSALLDAAVDFIRTYADRTHHGKEEDILFRDLEGKALSAEDRRAMDDLVKEHVCARQMVKELVEAKERWSGGDQDALKMIEERLKSLAGFYPTHIAKEDKVFFPASVKYLTREEQAVMIEEMREFDRKMIHEKYRAVVEQFEMRKGQPISPGLARLEK